jgi:hypothetical protein
MDPGAVLGQDVGGPVPAVGRLQDDLGRLAPRGDLGRQLERIRVDAHHRSDPLTGRRHAHDHATPLVQVDADVLPAVILFHQGPPSSWGLSGQPKRYARVTVTRGAEAPLLSSHQVNGAAHTLRGWVRAD